MALSNLIGWNKKMNVEAMAACGTACGSGDKQTACGAGGEKKVVRPAACGTACGAGDNK